MSTLMSAEATAIRQAALDYFEGWYDADVSRMERALHPELAKRFLDEADGAELRTTTAQRMFEPTRQGWKIVNALWQLR